MLTDLPPHTAEVAWYGLRAWVEGGFKDRKRDGWQWQRTRMSDPARATLWMLSVGGGAETGRPALPPCHIARHTASGRPTSRGLSCVRRSLFVLLANPITGRMLPRARFVPEPWPTSLHPKTCP